MTILGFVRHGITDWNIEKRAQGHQDIPLNPEGRNQVNALSLRLVSDHWDYIYSSDLNRAAETAIAISKVINKPVIYDKRLREVFWGALEGTTKEERIIKWGENWSELDHGIESDESASARGLSFVEEVINKHPDSKILFVSHGSLLDQILRGLLKDTELPSHLDNTSVTIISNTDGCWKINLFNCTKHL